MHSRMEYARLQNKNAIGVLMEQKPAAAQLWAIRSQQVSYADPLPVVPSKAAGRPARAFTSFSPSRTSTGSPSQSLSSSSDMGSRKSGTRLTSPSRMPRRTVFFIAWLPDPERAVRPPAQSERPACAGCPRMTYPSIWPRTSLLHLIGAKTTSSPAWADPTLPPRARRPSAAR